MPRHRFRSSSGEDAASLLVSLVRRFRDSLRMTRFRLLPVLLATCLQAAQPYYDRTHHSDVFHEDRTYRIFLPRDYDASSKSYPVIYYFHGHSDRYTLEHYDNGTDTVPKISDYVAAHGLIFVSVVTYVPRDY